MKNSVLLVGTLMLCGPVAHAAIQATYSGNTLRIPHVLYKEKLWDVTLTYEAPDKLTLNTVTLLQAPPSGISEVNVPDDPAFNLGEITVGDQSFRADINPVVKAIVPVIGTEFKVTGIMPSYHGKMYPGEAILGTGVVIDNGYSNIEGISDDGKIVATQASMGDEWTPLRLNFTNFSTEVLNRLPGGVDAWPFAANNNGAIAGADAINTTPDNKVDPKIYRTAFYNKTGKDLVKIGMLREGITSWAYGLNNKEVVVGWSTTKADESGHVAFMYDANTQKLSALTGGVLDGQLSFAFAINDANQITGVTTTAEGPSLAYIHKDGQTKTLGSFDDSGFSEARGINDKGWTTGWSATAEGALVAFIHDGTAMTKIPAIPGQTQSKGYDINTHGHVVGTYTDAEGTNKMFLYKDGKTMDLYGLLSAADKENWKDLVEVKGISDDGIIVGTGNYYVDKASKKEVGMGFRIKL